VGERHPPPPGGRKRPGAAVGTVFSSLAFYSIEDPARDACAVSGLVDCLVV